MLRKAPPAAKAAAQGFRIGRCIYDAARQQQLAAEMLRSVEDVARAMGENTNRAQRHPDNSFHDVFDSIEDDLLLIAALLKEPAFAEEQEWRAVSPIARLRSRSYSLSRRYIDAYPVYRVLASVCSRSYAGFSSGFRRTNPSHQQFNGVGNTVFNEGESESPPRGVSYCLIPYRTW